MAPKPLFAVGRGQSEDRFRAAAAECVEAAAKCSDADAAAALLVMAQRWLDLAYEHDKPGNHRSLAVHDFNERQMGNVGN